MSTLTYTGSDLVVDNTATSKSIRKSILARAYDAIVAAQRRRAEREIARYLATRGPLTDEIEREIMRRLSGGSSFK
jgi:hypothetical protein